jgi:hypothetical protein
LSAAPTSSFSASQSSESPTITPAYDLSGAPSQLATSAPSQLASSAPSIIPTQSPTSEAPSSAPTVIIHELFSGGDQSTSARSFRIDIKYDDKASQNAWHLFKGFGSGKKEVYAVDFGTLQSKAGMTVSVAFEDMPAGIYTFVIADLGNDGISNGRIAINEIEDGRDISLWENDGGFDFIIEQVFSV